MNHWWALKLTIGWHLNKSVVGIEMNSDYNFDTVATA
jgi:hypothetical protein